MTNQVTPGPRNHTFFIWWRNALATNRIALCLGVLKSRIFRTPSRDKKTEDVQVLSGSMRDVYVNRVNEQHNVDRAMR